MKKQIIIFMAVCISVVARAQTSPALVGVTSDGGVNSAGTIMQYTGGAKNVGLWVPLTSGNPQNSQLTQAPNGKFYGPVDDGVQTSFDAIIEYDYPNNSYKVVANFDTGTGTTPGGSLLLVADSTFYGLAYEGGKNNSGAIFSYTIGNSNIIKLADMPANAYPYGSLIQASDGNLYGMTENDGTHKSGTLFSYNINSKTVTPLVNLPSYAHPSGSLLEAGKDTLYGMAGNDSIKQTGYIFMYVTTTQVFTPLYYFQGIHTFSRGSLIKATDGLLYGMTGNGGTYSTGLYSGGMLFSYDRGTGAFDTLHNFGNGTDGMGPFGDPYQASDGILYGMTNAGGTSSLGTIFQYNISSHTYTLNVNLDAATGYYPGYGHFVEYQPTATGIAEVRVPSFNLYPCPTTGSFIIRDNYTGKIRVEILNLLGEKLKEFNVSGTQNQFDISDISAGIYEVRITDGMQLQKVLKVVKE